MYKLCIYTRYAAQTETIVQKAGALACYISADDPLDQKEAAYGAVVEAYFPDDYELDISTLPAYREFYRADIPDIDWVAESQKHLPALSIPPFYIYGTHARPVMRQARYHIHMDAANAFGTGYHATTQGCLTLFAQHIKRYNPKHIADIGTGSGLLAIAAAQACKSTVFAGDIDKASLEVAQKTIRKNHVHPFIYLAHADGFRHKLFQKNAPFDLIFANILARPLINHAPHIARLCAKDGALILSGVLTTQQNMLIATYHRFGFRAMKKHTQGDWTSLYLMR